MLLLLQTLAASRAAAWLGAATYVFSGVMVSEVFYLPLQGSAALLPWVLWSVARPAAGLGRKAVPIGVVFGLLFLLGDVFAVLIALIVSLLWIALEVARPERLRQAGALVVGIVLGGLLAAPQIVATALLAPETQRAVTGIRLQEGLAFTLSPWRLAELVVPYPFGDFWTLEDREAWGSVGFSGFLRDALLPVHSHSSPSWRPGENAGGVRDSAAPCSSSASASQPSSASFRAGWSGRTSWIPLRFPEKFAVAIAFAVAVLVGIAFDRFRGPARGGRPGFSASRSASPPPRARARLFPERIGEVASAAVGGLVGQRGERSAGSWPGRSRKRGCCGSRPSWPSSCCPAAGPSARGRRAPSS